MPLFYPRAKERGQNNQALSQSRAWAPRRPAAGAPRVCGIHGPCQTARPHTGPRPSRLFWPITKSGEKQEGRESPQGLPLAFPPQTQHDLSCRADGRFSGATDFYCEIQMFGRCVSILMALVKNYQFPVSRSKNILLSISFYCIVRCHTSEGKIKLDFIKGNFS